MTAKYTAKDGVKTALVSLTVGAAASALYVLPGLVTVPVLCLALYGLGVMDGRAGRRGGRAVESVRQARVTLVTLVRRPAGDRS